MKVVTKIKYKLTINRLIAHLIKKNIINIILHQLAKTLKNYTFF